MSKTQDLLNFINSQESEPELYVARRQGTAFQAAHVPLAADASSAFLSAAREFLKEVLDHRERLFDANAELERGEEYFLATRDELISAAALQVDDPSTLRMPSDAQTTRPRTGVALLDVLSDLDHANTLSVDAPLSSILFYVLRFEDGGSTMHLIKKQDPSSTMRRAKFTFVLGSALEVTPKPDFVLSNSFDIGMLGDDILVWLKSAFEQLASDVRVDLMKTATYASAVAQKLAPVVPLSSSSLEALAAVCGSRFSFARRLMALPERIASTDLSPDRIRESLASHGEDPAILLDHDHFSFTAEYVPAFLDVLEGRWFEDDFTGEKRRADRLSRRT